MVRVRDRILELAMIAGGITLVLIQIVPAASAALTGMPVRTPIPVQQQTPGPTLSPAAAANVPLVWREFRPGVRLAGPSTTAVRLCGAALQRGAERSALIVHFCNSQPTTPQRRFAFGYEDLRIRATLPGGILLDYDLLEYEPTRAGGTGFHERALPENNVVVTAVLVRNVTDLIFVFPGEIALGLPTVELFARYAGTEFRERHVFEPLGSDVDESEAERLGLAPDWANARY